MKIIHIAPVIAPLTPKAPGGAEQMVMSLADFQSREGHEVWVLAAEGSAIPAGPTLVSTGILETEITPIDTSQTIAPSEAEVSKRLAHDRKGFQKLEEKLEAVVANLSGDIVVHNHAFDFTPLFELNPFPNVRYIQTLHCPPLASWLVEGLKQYASRSDSTYVTVSESCADEWERASGVRPIAIPNGVEVDRIPFSEHPTAGVIWVGRISREKGLHTALDLVEANPDLELRVVGRIYDESYFRGEIEPRLASPRVRYLGFVERQEVFRLLGDSQVLLFPVEWDEPFGMILVESLAAGTPVVGFGRGAAETIVEQGKTGILCQTKEELRPALDRAMRLSRAECRKSVEARFGMKTTSAKYEALYQAR